MSTTNSLDFLLGVEKLEITQSLGDLEKNLKNPKLALTRSNRKKRISLTISETFYRDLRDIAERTGERETQVLLRCAEHGYSKLYEG